VVAQKGVPSLTCRPGSLDHVFGDARLRDCKPELEQFTMDTRRSPQRVLDAHLPDQRLQLRVNLRPPSPRARFPPPVAAKAGSMPAHGLGSDDRENIQDRREPSIQLDQESAIAVREPDPPLHLAPQDDQLMSERCIFCLKPALRLEWRGQDGQHETQQRNHGAPTLGDSFG
jgi:hypothetical protein